MMATRISEAGIRPSLILSSPAVRAWTTAKAVANEIAYPLEFLQRESELYLAGTQTLINVVAKQDAGFSSIMLVGHNPGLTEFANFMLPGLTDNVPTCGVVVIQVEANDWDLRSATNFELISYDYPKK